MAKKASSKNGNWKNFLGDSRATFYNARVALQHAPEWHGVLRFDEFLLETEAVKKTPWGFTGRWTDRQDMDFLTWLQANDIFLTSTSTAAQAIEAEAQNHPFHPVREFLDKAAAEWDHKSRLNDWLVTYLGAGEVSADYLRAIGARFLIQAVHRIYEPGCQADYMLLSQGPQGRFKTSCYGVLFQPYFTDNLSDIGGKDAMLELQRVWCAELGELEAIRTREVSTVKNFISRRKDLFRSPYGRRVNIYARHNVFTGSSNDQEILKDATGNRRFWIVPIVNYGNPDALAKDREQLFGEAVSRYRAGERSWIDEREEPELAQQIEAVHKPRMEQDPWHDTAIEYLATNPKSLIDEILTKGIQKPIKDQTQADRNRVGRILRAAGAEVSKGTDQKRRWKLPEDPDKPFCTVCKGNHLGECKTTKVAVN